MDEWLFYFLSSLRQIHNLSKRTMAQLLPTYVLVPCVLRRPGGAYTAERGNMYHLEATIISRGDGRSAVAAAAYRAAEKLTSMWDGVVSDYTHKSGVVWKEIFQTGGSQYNREELWNAVEMRGDKRLAREYTIALPIELTLEQNISLIKEFISKAFTPYGIIADACLHDKKGNPHVHIMTPLCSYKDGWKDKNIKLHLLVNDNEERAFTKEQLKEAEANGWEKQYKYNDNGTPIWLPKSKADGYDRWVGKTGKVFYEDKRATVSESGFDTVEKLKEIRKDWEIAVNTHLKNAGVDKRVSCESYVNQGIEKIPTIHMGPYINGLEKRGIKTHVGNINRMIREYNSIKDVYNKITNKIDDLRDNIITALLRLKRISNRIPAYTESEISRIQTCYEQYTTYNNKNLTNQAERILKTYGYEENQLYTNYEGVQRELLLQEKYDSLCVRLKKIIRESLDRLVKIIKNIPDYKPNKYINPDYSESEIQVAEKQCNRMISESLNGNTILHTHYNQPQ